MKTIHILAIVGASGSGKTTISKQMRKAGIPDIISYTTRPKRQCETDGVEHYFIDEDMADCLLSTVKPLAYTKIAGYQYFALFSQLILCDICTYVIDEVGVRMLNDKIAAINASQQSVKVDVIVIHVERDAVKIASQVDAERIARDTERIPLQESDIDLHIVNDAPYSDVLSRWSCDFATALISVLNIHHGIKKSVLHTSETGIHRMIDQLNPSYDEVKK